MREKRIKSERLKKEGFGRTEQGMVTNVAFGQIKDEGDNPGFFKILRREDLSSEITVTLNFPIPHHRFSW